jgi:hypothetical protein
VGGEAQSLDETSKLFSYILSISRFGSIQDEGSTPRQGTLVYVR